MYVIDCESSKTTIVAGVLLKSTRTPLLADNVLISIKSGITAWSALITPSLTRAVALEDQLFDNKSKRRETSSIIIPPHLIVFLLLFETLLMQISLLLHH